MKVIQAVFIEGQGWVPPFPKAALNDFQLILVFGSRELIDQKAGYEEIRRVFPTARVLGCSTAGQIAGTRVLDEGLVATAVAFERSQLKFVSEVVGGAAESRSAGRKLAAALSPEGLAHVLVLSEGLRVNGSELVQGLNDGLPPGVAVTGGMAGDGARFQQTRVGLDGQALPGAIVAVGFYGSSLEVGYGSLGGWDPFGVEWEVTKSRGNVLFELDQKSALGLYKDYLGPHAADLPSSGLLFPLLVRLPGGGEPVVRTILQVHESDQSIVFAGDIPEGSFARFMKANFDRLVEGAAGAARACQSGMGTGKAQLGILISCVGRKLVLKQRTEEEVEAVSEVLGDQAVLTGFYSYGEVCPFKADERSELHNQTMTVTTFSET